MPTQFVHNSGSHTKVSQVTASQLQICVHTKSKTQTFKDKGDKGIIICLNNTTFNSNGHAEAEFKHLMTL